LTIHGYLHLFLPDPKDPKAKEAEAETELVEADVKASVYAPRATKCVFQRKGQELELWQKIYISKHFKLIWK